MKAMKVAAALKVLGLKPGAQSKDVKKAYYKLARDSHPDKGPPRLTCVCACALCMARDVFKLRGLGFPRRPKRKRNRRRREDLPERQGRVRRPDGGPYVEPTRLSTYDSIVR